MTIYGWVLALSVIFPIIFSFHPKITFYKKWKNTFISGLMVAIPFWVWDAIATHRGDWSFNENYVGQTRIAGMPIEEVLFFLVIPFCCLFIWQILDKNKKDKQVGVNHRVWIIIAFVTAILAIILRGKFYTSTILWWSVITLLVTVRFSQNLFLRLNYWKWIAITFIPFLIVNGILTYLPVVRYSSQAILGLKFITIPVEDFFYSWSLLTLNLVIYEKLNINADI